MKSDMFVALSEMFFLSKCHIRGVVLDSDKLIFTWQKAFFFGCVCVCVCVLSSHYGHLKFRQTQ